MSLLSQNSRLGFYAPSQNNRKVSEAETARYEAEAEAEFEALKARQKARAADPNVIAQEAEQAARRAERYELGLHNYASNNAVAARRNELRKSRVAGFARARNTAYTERKNAWKKMNGKWTPVGGKRSTRKAKKSTRKTRKH
jgi:hypothetical protein